jgi:hypothetical protein
MIQATESQISYIRSLIAKIEVKKVAAPKKASRWNDPVRAHAQHVERARQILADLNAGEMTKAAASTHIPTLKMWAM